MEEALKLLLGSAGGLAALIFAVQWLNRDRDKVLHTLSEERNERIKALEESSKRCSEDRIVLHNEVNALQAEVRALFRKMIESKFLGHCKGECLNAAPPSETQNPQ